MRRKLTSACVGVIGLVASWAAIAGPDGLPASAQVAPRTPVMLRWSIGLQGGTVAVDVAAARQTRTGGVEHFVSVPCVLDPALSAAREEAAPTSPYLALVVVELAGATTATFCIEGHPTARRPNQATNPKEVCFWSRFDEEVSPSVRIPAIGRWHTVDGVDVASLTATSSVDVAGVPWYVAKRTESLPGGGTSTTYFIK